MKDYEQLELPLELPPYQLNPYTPLIDPYWDQIIVLEQAQKQENVLEQEQEKNAPEQEKVCIYSNNLAPEHTYCHWVEIYSPSNRKQHKYYRYCWMEGRKLRHLHIRGGSITNPVASAMKERVELAISSRLSPEEINILLATGKTH